MPVSEEISTAYTLFTVSNECTQDHFDEFIQLYTRFDVSFTFVDTFSFGLESKTNKVIFVTSSVIIMLVGIFGNSCIVVTNLLYRIRFQHESEFFATAVRQKPRSLRKSLNPFRVEITQENRFSYFDALSKQAKFRYSHVIFAIAVFNLLSSLIYIPLAIAGVCKLATSIMVDNWVLVLCSGWSAFQLLFMCAFFFVNTTIQFLSLVFPLTFTLQRSPLWVTFLAVVAICILQTFLTVMLIVKELSHLVAVVQLHLSKSGNELIITGVQAALTLPVIVYGLTWILTIAMYSVIIRHIHAAIVNVYKITEITPRSLPRQQNLWQRVVKKNIRKCMVLGAGTTIFYVLELPITISVLHGFEPDIWTLLAHLAVHAITPFMHIMLSKSFRTTLYGIAARRRRETPQLSVTS